MNRRVVLLIGLILVIGSAMPMVAQCTDETSFEYTYATTTRLNGNDVRGFAAHSIVGNYRYYWYMYLQSWFYRSGTQIGSYPFGYASPPGATAAQTYDATLSYWGPGNYGVTAYFSSYTPYCDFWEPPWLNGDNDPWQYSNVTTVVRPGRPDYAVGATPYLVYLGRGISLDGGYQAQTVFRPGAANGAPESPVYVIAAGSDKLSLSCTNCTNPTAIATAASSGCQVYDVVVQTSYNGFLSEPFWIFINRPWNLVAGNPWVQSSAKNKGYETLVAYSTSGLCLTDPPFSNYHINEQFTGNLQPDYSGTNWPTTPPAGEQYVPYTVWADRISIFNLGTLPGDPAMCGSVLCVPQFTSPGVLPHALVEHTGQNWFVGGPYPGTGLRVQSNTIQLYTDSGWHTNITTPNP